MPRNEVEIYPLPTPPQRDPDEMITVLHPVTGVQINRTRRRIQLFGELELGFGKYANNIMRAVLQNHHGYVAWAKWKARHPPVADEEWSIRMMDFVIFVCLWEKIAG